MFLKADTATSVILGPFVDATDGVTPETGLTVAAGDFDGTSCDLYKNSVTATSITLTDSAGSNDIAHVANGYYSLELTATDTNTEGWLTISMTLGGTPTADFVPFSKTFQVVNANVYDSLFAAATTDYLQVDAIQISGDATASDNLELFFDGTGYNASNSTVGTATNLTTNNDKTGYRLSATGVDDIWDEAASGHVTAGSFGARMAIARSATAQAGASTTITLDASASATNDFYNNNIIYVVSGTGAIQGNRITDYDGTTKVATVQDTWATNPSSDSVFVIIPEGTIPGASAPSAATVADAVWDEAMADHISEGSFGTMLQSGHEGTAQAGSASSITLDATGSSSTTDFYKYQIIAVFSGTGAGQARQITAYNGTTKVATVEPDWTTAPSTDSEYVIKDLGIDAATIAQIADGVWDEARSGHVTAGSFGEYVLADAIRVSGSATAADGLEAAVSGATPLPSNMTQISGDAVAADNLESYTDGTTPMPVNATQISGDSTAADNLEAAFDGTGGVTISANLDGYAEIRTSGGTAGDNSADLVASILTTQMTEAYNTDGTAPTLAQALFVIMQRLTESEVSGTTLTVKKLDGSTTAYTMTLDDGTTPTTSTRAT